MPTGSEKPRSPSGAVVRAVAGAASHVPAPLASVAPLSAAQQRLPSAAPSAAYPVKPMLATNPPTSEVHLWARVLY